MTTQIAHLIESCEWYTSSFLIFSENVFVPLIYYSHLGILIPILLIGLFVLINSKNDLSGRLLFLTTLSAGLWILGDLVLWATEYPQYTMFFWSFLILIEPFIYFFAFYFVYTFFFKRDLSLKQKLFFGAFLLPTIILAPTKWALLGFDLSNCDRGAYEGIAASYGYFVEILYVLFILGYAFKASKEAAEKTRKRQIFLLTLGTVAFLLSFSLGNIVEVFTENWYIGQYGLFGAPIFIAFLAYLMVKYSAFNIRLLGAQALVTGVWLLVLSLLFIQTIENVRIVTAATLFLIFILGILLVRSVKREVEQRQRVEKLARELQTTNEQLSEFMSLATHEIRNPATFIRGTAATALEGSLGPVDANLRTHLQRILIRASDIIHLGNQYLNKSKLELDKMTYEFVPTDLGELVKELAQEAAPAAEQKKLALRAEVPAGDHVVEADAGKIKETISNLIDNAVKYTPEGGSVTLSVASDANAVRVSIRDTGVGIPPEVIPNLFQKFSRADAQKKNLMGTGLGLYLGKVFVEAHHGRLWVESPGKGKGSTFYIELPRRQK